MPGLTIDEYSGFTNKELPQILLDETIRSGLIKTCENHEEKPRSSLDELLKSRKPVTPAKAGVHDILEYLDSRVRGNDKKRTKRPFYERIKS